MHILSRYINLGTKKHTHITSVKYIRFTNALALIIVCFIIQNIIVAAAHRQFNLYPILFLHLIGIALIPYFNALGKRLFGAVWFCGVAITFVTIYAHVYKMDGLNFVFLPFIIFIQFFIFSRAESRYIIVFTIIVICCLLAVVLWESSGRPPFMTVSEELIRAQRLNTIVGLPALTMAIGYYAFYTINSAENAASVEKEKTERLLLNILPAPIAERFKDDQSYLAERFESASVLFADIVGFTSLSEKISPENLAIFLNEVFSKYDSLTEEQGLEKIKTIGDAYMVAGGIPTPSQDHIQRICALALRMQECTREIRNPMDTPMEIRIGISTGPVTAGVIGVKKFNYDLWGDTVNTASRMQSHAPGGGIQITQAMYEQVKDEFICEMRGVINVRGKGDMQTYLLTGKKHYPGNSNTTTEFGGISTMS